MAMSRWERKAALRHGAMKEVAKRTGRTLGHVSEVVRGNRRDRKVEVAIARAVGKPVDEVFEPLAPKVGAA